MNLFTKKVICRGCKGTLKDPFDGGSCLDCHGKGYEEMTLFQIGKYNKLVNKYGHETDKVQRIT